MTTRDLHKLNVLAPTITTALSIEKQYHNALMKL